MAKGSLMTPLRKLLFFLFIAFMAAQMVQLAAWASGLNRGFAVADCRPLWTGESLALLPDYTRPLPASSPALTAAARIERSPVSEVTNESLASERPEARMATDEKTPTGADEEFDRGSISGLLAVSMDRMSQVKSQTYTLRHDLHEKRHQLEARGEITTVSSRSLSVSPVEMELRLAMEHPEIAPEIRREIAGHVTAKAREYDLDPWILFALIEVESSFNHQARGKAGEYGLMQILPSTARDLARNVKGIEQLNLNRLYDPGFNIELGTAYLDWQMEAYGDSVPLALTAYNMGNARNGVNGYARKVLAVHERLMRENAGGSLAAAR